MPYEEVYFQRLEENDPEVYEKIKSKKSSLVFLQNLYSVNSQDLQCLRD